MPSTEQLNKVKQVVELLKRKPSEVLALDIGVTAIKAVRMKKANDEIALLSAAIMPAVALPRSAEDSPIEVDPLELSKDLAGRYASMAVPGVSSVIKLLSFPSQGGSIEEEVETKIVESIGVEDPDNYRIGYKLVHEGQGRSESRALVVALPEAEAATACGLLPAGLPVPYSVEIAGLAATTAFMQGPGKEHEDDAVD